MQRPELYLLRQPFWFGFRFAAGVALGALTGMAIADAAHGFWLWTVSAFEYH